MHESWLGMILRLLSWNLGDTVEISDSVVDPVLVLANSMAAAELDLLCEEIRDVVWFHDSRTELKVTVL